MKNNKLQDKQINTKAIYNLYLTSESIDNKLSYKDFKFIINKYCKEVCNLIIEGDKIDITGIGQFEVLKFTRTFKENDTKAINWHESNKVRKELEDQGVVLKTKDNPDGRNWFVYFTSSFYFGWNWYINKGASYTKNIRGYYFTPTWHNKRNLSKHIKEDTLAELKYGIYK
jgi:nucleoid DNA-binding protein